MVLSCPLAFVCLVGWFVLTFLFGLLGNSPLFVAQRPVTRPFTLISVPAAVSPTICTGFWRAKFDQCCFANHTNQRQKKKSAPLSFFLLLLILCSCVCVCVCVCVCGKNQTCGNTPHFPSSSTAGSRHKNTRQARKGISNGGEHKIKRFAKKQQACAHNGTKWQSKTHNHNHDCPCSSVHKPNSNNIPTGASLRSHMHVW